ncbi:hypothetical protein [Amycolatopsis sp. GM8]|uniref:hypothetical protein n=1 Tax=Amycolatopsis sp. GM8 TaxID=2896530 RepID=UPI001F247AB7|nr:hypothetical protein [Amycolatopsis sp. GM8]
MRFLPSPVRNRLRFRLRGKRFLLARRAFAVGLLLVAAVLAVRPAASPPTSAEPARARASPDVSTARQPGLSTVPIHLADASVADLLTPGTRVDVVTADDGDLSRRVVASMATVVDIRPPPDGGSRFTSGESKGPLVLIAVPTDTATQVAALSLRKLVTVTLR